MAYAADLKSAAREGLGVRIPSPVLCRGLRET